MLIAVFFRNGIGNAVIFTSVINALKYHSGEDKVDLFLDDSWIGNTRDQVELIFKNMKGVNVLGFPSQYEEKYDLEYMSKHSVFMSESFEHVHGNSAIAIDTIPSWASSFMSERDFYYQEIIEYFNYRGPIFPQSMFYDKNFKLPKGNFKITIANGFQRTTDNVFRRKQYGRFVEVADTLKRMYGDIDFYLLGGPEDKEWSEDFTSKIEATDYCGELNILQTAAAIIKSYAFMGNDSSCFHIADALKVEGIVIFGSTLCSKNGPLNGKIIPIRSPLKCAACQSTVFFKMCEDPSKCMDAIDSSMVVGAMNKILKERYI